MTQSRYTKLDITNIPSAPGVYLMRDSAGRIIYIGKAGNLKKRVSSYFRPDQTYKTLALVNALKHIDFILAASESEAMILEDRLIKQYRPYYNVMLKDSKTYPYLKLTLKEDFPRLFLTRSKIKDGSEYFGPYPHIKEIKDIYQWLRNIFPWRYCDMQIEQDKLPKPEKFKSCLYLHTARCTAPCAGKISSQEYKKGINDIRLFLKGKYKLLSRSWEKEMKAAASNLEFEKARIIRDRLKALKTTNQRVTMREILPEQLESSLSVSQVLEKLKMDLNLKKWPVVIEGFDISNISGTDSVASMVRFQNAKPDKAGYRKFRIKTVEGPNDTAMINEAVKRRYRRLKNDEAVMPDLVLIDGGPGQLNSAKQALEDLGVNLPLVSLAKRDEEVYFPDTQYPLKLNKDSKSLHLLQFVRDEAHRFAVSYHHVRRNKRMKLK